MLIVDDAFIKKLHAGQVYAEQIHSTLKPERPWHLKKVSTFLSKLAAQSGSSASATSPPDIPF